MADTKKRSLGSVALVLFYGSAALGRLLRILYTVLQSNIVSRDTFWADAVYFLAFFLDLLLLGSAIGLIPLATLRLGKKPGFLMFLLFVGAEVFYALTAFLVDVLMNRLSGLEALAFLNLSLTVGIPVLGALLCYLISLLCRKKTVIRAIVFSVLAFLFLNLVRVGWDISSFLKTVRYPTETEVISMLKDLISTIGHTGIVVLGVGIGVYLIAQKMTGGQK